MNRRRAHGQRHDQRGLIAVSGDVADHHAGLARAEPEQIVEIAADALRRHDARGHDRFRRDDAVVRQQLHLQVVRELHLVRETLLLRPTSERGACSEWPCRSASRSRR